jgi:hypothetical protein
VSGRDDQALPTVLKTSSRDGLVTPGLTQIVGKLQIQGQGGSLAARIQNQIDSRAVQRLALLADKERPAGRFHPDALLEPCADGLELVATQGLSGREAVLQADDVQHAASHVHLVERQTASLGYAKAVPEHQQQQATVAGLVAGASGCGHQLADLESGQVVATGLAPPPRVSFPG